MPKDFRAIRHIKFFSMQHHDKATSNNKTTTTTRQQQQQQQHNNTIDYTTKKVITNTHRIMLSTAIIRKEISSVDFGYVFFCVGLLLGGFRYVGLLFLSLHHTHTQLL
jgi:hypothetical protein